MGPALAAAAGRQRVRLTDHSRIPGLEDVLNLDQGILASSMTMRYVLSPCWAGLDLRVAADEPRHGGRHCARDADENSVTLESTSMAEAIKQMTKRSSH